MPVTSPLSIHTDCPEELLFSPRTMANRGDKIAVGTFPHPIYIYALFVPRALSAFKVRIDIRIWKIKKAGVPLRTDKNLHKVWWAGGGKKTRWSNPRSRAKRPAISPKNILVCYVSWNCRWPCMMTFVPPSSQAYVPANLEIWVNLRTVTMSRWLHLATVGKAPLGGRNLSRESIWKILYFLFIVGEGTFLNYLVWLRQSLHPDQDGGEVRMLPSAGPPGGGEE